MSLFWADDIIFFASTSPTKKYNEQT